MEWRFDAITPQTTKVEARHIEFFQSEALDDVTSALIREDIQNRLDAKPRKSEAPVRVRYYLSEHAALSSDRAKPWMQSLDPHLNSKQSLEELKTEHIDLDVQMPYLTIEDFNTTGLKGDPLATKDPEDIEDRNDFYWFIRNVGRTRKKAGDRGRWGLGKIVYPAASLIRSFFCYSVREGDHKETLIGRSVLQIHSIDGKEYQSEGYFGEFLNSDYPYFASPSDSPQLIKEFVDCFKITRSSNQPGLSLVIPFPDPTIKSSQLIKGILNHYFWEIQKGTLEILVSHDGGNDLLITKSTIHDIAKSWPGLDEDEKKTVQRRLEFCRKADRLALRQGNTYFELAEPTAYGSPIVENQFKPEEYDRARSLYQSGNIVAFELPVKVEKVKDGVPRPSSFLVYLQKDEELETPDESFIRDGLTIIGEKAIQAHGVRAFVLAEDPVLTEFLGDAENPAHTRWLVSTNHFKGKYSKGNALLDYVKRSANRLANSLGRIEDQQLPNLLDHVFGIPDNEGKADNKTPRGRGNETPKKLIIPEGRPKQFRIEQLGQKTGFKVVPTAEAVKTPSTLKIRFAYEVMQGNAFRQYHPADFDVANPAAGMKILYKSCHARSCGGNEIEVQPDKPDYSIEVVGFDPNRDLLVDVKANYEQDNAGAAE